MCAGLLRDERNTPGKVGTPPLRAAVLLLADGRFPAGAHAHSAGMETAIGTGVVRDLADVSSWARDVVGTVGFTAAGLAARGCLLAAAGDREPAGAWDRLDAEADARTPSPVQRDVARRLGRQLLRTACRVWASDLLVELADRWPGGPHRPVAYGAAVAVAGGTPGDAALGEAYGAVAVPVGAAVRLLGLDPVAGAAVVAELAPAMEEVARRAAEAADTDDVARLPSRSSPMVDVCAELRAGAEGALFAS